MQLPAIMHLPSGKWHAQIQVDGRRYSVTAATKQVVRQKLKELAADIGTEEKVPMTVGAMIDAYIDYRSKRLSPSTILNYKKVRRKYLQSIMGVNVSRLTDERIQDAIDEDDDFGYSPKTLRNAYGLLTASLAKYRPKYKPNVELPELEHKEIAIPSETEITEIWRRSKEEGIELPVVLAFWLGLRMSEILGLKYKDLHGNCLYIQRAKVQGDKGTVVKGTKTPSGVRRIECPEYIKTLIERQTHASPEDFLITQCRKSVNSRFTKICSELGYPHYRMHDLRHFSASESLALNIPDKYQMRRMGHKTDHMLKNVYQHTIREREIEFANIIDARMLAFIPNSSANASANEN